MSQKCLTIVPSRGRPELLMEMMTSWAVTRRMEGRLIAYISPDDPRYDGYTKLGPLPDGCTIISAPREFCIRTYNKAIAAYPDYDYYAPLNDDHYCVTEGWDVKLAQLLEEKSNGWGCAMAEDKLTNWNLFPHPSGCIISKKTIDVMGYFAYPKLRHIGSDVTIGRLFRALGILHGTKDVLIEHRHWSNGMRPFDDNYRWVYGKEEQDYGNAMITEYLYEHLNNDMRKLREAMAREAQER